MFSEEEGGQVDEAFEAAESGDEEGVNKNVNNVRILVDLF